MRKTLAGTTLFLAAPLTLGLAAGVARAQPTTPAPTVMTAHHPPANVCSSIRAEIIVQDENHPALLALTNTGRAACTVHGWAEVKPTGADGNVIDLLTHRVNQPGPGTATTLRPGRTAFAGVKWKLCDPGAHACHVATGIEVGAPGDNHRVNATLIGFFRGGNQPVQRLPISSLEVGTLQPSSQGVVAW